MVDEAHATGVLGPRGRAWPKPWASPGKWISTWARFSKALGSLGGLRGRGPAPGGLPAQPGPVVHLLHRPGRPRCWGRLARPWRLWRRSRSAGFFYWRNPRLSPEASARRGWIAWGAKPRSSRCWWAKTPAPWSSPPASGAGSHGGGLPSAHGDRRAGPGCGFPCPRPTPGRICTPPGRPSFRWAARWVSSHDQFGFSARLGYLRPYLAPPNRGLGQGGTDGVDPRPSLPGRFPGWWII